MTKYLYLNLSYSLVPMKFYVNIPDQNFIFGNSCNQQHWCILLVYKNGRELTLYFRQKQEFYWLPFPFTKVNYITGSLIRFIIYKMDKVIVLLNYICTISIISLRLRF